MNRMHLLAPLLFATALTASAPIDGTWRVDLSKHQPSDKPQTYLFQNGRYACPTCVPPIDIKADGSDQPVAGNPYVTVMNVRIVDDKTIEMVNKKDGKIVSSMKGTLSADGTRIVVASTNYPQGSQSPVTGTFVLLRTAAGPAGAHAQSGSWRFEKAEGVSENGLLFTYKSTNNGLTYSTPTGESYTASFDGKDYPYKGNPGVNSITIKRVDDRTIEEVGKLDGKPVFVTTMTIAADGQSMDVVAEDKIHGTTDKYVARKQ